MLACLSTLQQRQWCSERDVPLSLLKVNHTHWNLRTVPNTGDATYTGGFEVMPIRICLIDRLVVMAGGFLHDNQS